MPTDGTYKIGPPKRPNINHDNGFLDKYAPRDPSYSDRARAILWRGVLEAAEAAQGVPFVPHNDIPDALAAYRHFLNGNGKDRTFSYERYMANDESGKTTYKNQLSEAVWAAFGMYQSQPFMKDRSFDFTGSALAASTMSRRYPYPATENWQKAIGAHSFWISGHMEAKGEKGKEIFTLTYTVHVEDRYNFNPGQSDIATSLPDAANGELAVAGLAKQYTNYATYSRTVTWTGRPSTVTYLASPPSGRERQPSDNRRARNRL